jgi:hypothetical protein
MQPEVIDQNQQMVQPIQSQNQFSNFYEKFSKCITGSKTIPLIVFIIIILISLFFIIVLFLPAPTFASKLKTIVFSLGEYLFAICVWAPMAVKIEKNTSTARYGCLFLINWFFLSIFTISFPFCLNRLWCFVLFETLLIALSNKDKKIRFFHFKIGGNAVIVLSIVYNTIMNWNVFYCVIITVAYTLVYQKYLIVKFGISNERVERIENFRFVNWIKRKVTTFVSLKDVLERGQNSQPLVQNNAQNPNESSFIPANMYPNYYSSVDPNMQQMEPTPQDEEIENVESDMNRPPQ